MNFTNIELQLFDKDTSFPKRSTYFSAGYDVFASCNITIPAKSSYRLHLPINFNGENKELEQYLLMVTVRSSYGIKKKLRVLNEKKEYITAAYFSLSDESFVVHLYNDAEFDLHIQKNEHFLQMLLLKKKDGNATVLFENVSEAEASKHTYIDFSINESDRNYSLFLNESIVLKPFEQVTLPIGMKASFSRGDWLQATISGDYKENVIFANSTPVIDADYYNNPDNEGHIFIGLVNTTSKEVVLKEKTEICMFKANPFYLFKNEIQPVNKREGGIGSTTK